MLTNNANAAYEKVIELAREIGDQSLEATQRKNQGVVLKSRAQALAPGTDEYGQRLEAAGANYDLALDVHTRLGSHLECVKALRGKAGVRLMQERFDEALVLARESGALGKAIGYKSGVTRAQRLEAEVVVTKIEKALAASEGSVADADLLAALQVTREVLAVAEKGGKRPGDAARALEVLARAQRVAAAVARTWRTGASSGEAPITHATAQATLAKSAEMYQRAGDVGRIKEMQKLAAEWRAEQVRQQRKE